MWGQVWDDLKNNTPSGIIPTRVGTRRWEVLHTLQPWDHPHACGDKTAFLPICATTWGSSPRVWGQEDFRVNVFIIHRIIPTRVGTRLQVTQNHQQRKDHPHACGDKSELAVTVKPPPGSSPRVWGQGAVTRCRF